MSRPDPGTSVGAIGWMAGNSVAANLIMLIVLIGGLFTLGRIRQEVFPDLSPDIVVVSVPYPGASPEEVETGIVLVVEEAVQSLDGIKEITSTASEGIGVVMIELLEGEDLQKLSDDVKGEIDRITTFPQEAERHSVVQASTPRNVITLVVHGNAEERQLHNIVEGMRDELLQHESIAQVEPGGVRPTEIKIEVSQDNLRRHGISLADVASRIRLASLELPGGGVKTRGGEILVRVSERRDWGAEFARLPILSTPGGASVLLGELATITDGYSDTDLRSLYNGEPAMTLDVSRVGDQTPIEVATAVRQEVERIEATLPEGISISVLNDQSEIFTQRIDLLLRNMGFGLILILIILGLFLETRLAFWVMMGIPISFMGALISMHIMGASINMVTLFAFIIGLGIVVDDAIVIGENIYSRRQGGMKPLKAAIEGARELAVPITFSILTNIVAFMPLFFISGMMGRVFGMIPVVVISAFVVSLFESLFILPAHLAHQKEKIRYGWALRLHEFQQAFGNGLSSWTDRYFAPALKRVLRWRYAAISTGVALLVLSVSYVASGRMGFSLFPEVESDFALATVELSYGSSIEATEAVTERLTRAAESVIAESGHPELMTGILVDLGKEGGHTAVVRVTLADPEIRDDIMSTAEFVERWRRTTGEIAGLKDLTFAFDHGGPGSGKALTIELSHRSTEVLEAASRDVALALQSFPIVSAINDGFQKGKVQLDITLRPEARSLGLTSSGVAQQVRNAFYGAEALRQQRGRNEVRVMVRLPEAERISETHIDDLLLMTPAGRYVPLGDVVDTHRGRAFTTINRRDGRRIVNVTGDVTPRSKANEVIGALIENELPAIQDRYPGLIVSFEGSTADQRESIASLLQGFLFAMLGVFLLLAIPFRSYLQPLIVMAAIPFGIIGAILGHLIMGYSMSVISLFGIVALSGVVVNGSLILIDHANRLRAQGIPVEEAVLQSAMSRFRPILLTTLTTFFGLAPMILETAMQARFLIPMAISLGFGILFATVITLLLVPALYLILEDAGRIAFEAGNGIARLRGRPVKERTSGTVSES